MIELLASWGRSSDIRAKHRYSQIKRFKYPRIWEWQLWYWPLHVRVIISRPRLTKEIQRHE